MPFNQTEYISNFNKNNYKMYQFRVKKSDINIINHLDNIENRNGYIVSLINTDINNSIYTIKEIKNIIKPILNKYGITEIYLFGSYAKNKANDESDIDLLICTSETGLVFFGIIEELRGKLHKKIDLLNIDQLNGNQELLREILKDGIKIYG